ncbi:sodium-coupled monocarboxylate transporter 1-like [Liolophura sinensis]|uniref:sodium-coupled monocarboxylate transporter 1-like n=1 Tax=Liolophura sinensis TaxID=3198878 RepID=UPI003158D744
MSDYDESISFRSGQKNTFHWLDYVLFGAMLSGSAGIGVFYAIKDRKRQNTKEFLLAGSNMNPLVVALSLLASFMSAITLLGTPAEMYNYGTMYFWIGLSYLFVVFGAAHVYIPIFYNLNVTSAYEYLEKRFSRGVRTAGSITFCIQMLLYMAIVLYAPSLALNAVTGFTLWGSVISVGVVCIFYTTLGGMKAVLWTDAFQASMMFAGLIAVLIQGSIVKGGFENAWQIAAENHRVYFTDFDPDPAVRHSFWALVVGGTFTWVAIYGTNQAQVQRACTCGTLRRAQISLWLNFPGLCLILYLCCLIGIVIYAFYSECDPKAFGLIFASDQLYPLFVMDVLGKIPGIPGLFISCLFSGALSTISSGLNSLSAVILTDVISQYFIKDMNEKTAMTVSRILAVVCGVVCLALSYVASLLGGVLQAALSLFGMIAGPLLGVFTLGMIFPWANAYGAYAGLFSSLAFLFWIGIGAQVYKPPIRPTPPNISTIACNWNLTSTTVSTTLNMTMTSTMAGVTEAATQVVTETTTLAAMETTTHSPDYILYTVSYLWYSAIAVLTCVVVGLLVSCATGFTRPKDLDPKLICPLMDVLCPFLPDSWRKPFRFGIDHSNKERRSSGTKQPDAEKQSYDNPAMAGISSALEKERQAAEKDGVRNGSTIQPPPYSEVVEQETRDTKL